MTILGRHKSVDVNFVLRVLDLLRVVQTAAILALVLVLFNVDENIIWERDVYKGIKATTVSFEGFSLTNIRWKIGQYKSVLGLRRKAEKL